MNTLSRNDKDMFISRIAFISLFHNYSYTSLYKDKKSLLKDLQMFYGCFIFIKEVIKNHLISFIIKGAYYLAIIKSNIIDLGPPFISRINSYKHLIPRI